MKTNKLDNKKSTPVKTENELTERQKRQERSRLHRIQSIIKLGISKELVAEMMAEENNRTILVLLDGRYTVQDGTREKKVTKRDEHHKIVSRETITVENILRGFNAAKKYVDDQKLHFVAGGSDYIVILSDASHVDEDVKKLQVLGRISVTKPDAYNKEKVEKDIKKAKKTAKEKKPSNNTAEVKKQAKARRKERNEKNAEMRPYYAALRKGGVCVRIKKHNKPLAEKIEKWLKERKAAEEKKAEADKERRAKHRQLTSIEMKANKRARKVAKRLATIERVEARGKKRAAINAKTTARKSKKARKPVQTKLKMAA